MKLQKQQDENLYLAMQSRARGCESKEVIEEYAIDEEQKDVKLIKKKITTKYLPPDVSAAKMCLGMTQENLGIYQDMTDEELFAEKKRLLSMLKDMEEEDGDYQDDSQD